jgi:hypothetical protein
MLPGMHMSVAARVCATTAIMNDHTRPPPGEGSALLHEKGAPSPPAAFDGQTWPPSPATVAAAAVRGRCGGYF